MGYKCIQVLNKVKYFGIGKKAVTSFFVFKVSLLFSGGLGQLGVGLAKLLRYVMML